MAEIGKSVYRSFLPSSKEKHHRRAKTVALNHSLGQAATPWGWGSDTGGPRRAVPVKKAAAPAPSATPWGWKGNGRHVERRGHSVAEDVSSAANALKGAVTRTDNDSHRASTNKEEPQVGWPYREEKFSFAGDDYKVTRKPRVSKTTKGGSKPWGW